MRSPVGDGSLECQPVDRESVCELVQWTSARFASGVAIRGWFAASRCSSRACRRPSLTGAWTRAVSWTCGPTQQRPAVRAAVDGVRRQPPRQRQRARRVQERPHGRKATSPAHGPGLGPKSRHGDASALCDHRPHFQRTRPNRYRIGYHSCSRLLLNMRIQPLLAVQLTSLHYSASCSHWKTLPLTLR